MGERGLSIGGGGSEFSDSSTIYIGLLVYLIFVFLLFIKAFKQDNTRIANILAAIFSFWV